MDSFILFEFRLLPLYVRTLKRRTERSGLAGVEEDGCNALVQHISLDVRLEGGLAV